MSTMTRKTGETLDIETGEASGKFDFPKETNDDLDLASISSSSTSSVSSTTSSTARQSPGEINVVIPRANILRRLWDRRNANISTNTPLLENLMRSLFLVLMFLKAILESPLSYLGVDDSTDDSNKSEERSNETTKEDSKLPIRRGIVGTSLGRVGYLLCDGTSPTSRREETLAPILCIHSCRQSSDEFYEVLPLLAANKRKVVAIDLYGHGMSENHSYKYTSTTTTKNMIDSIADSAILEVALSLGGMEKFILLVNGGAYKLAATVAARYPRRIVACVVVNICSSFESSFQSSTQQPFQQILKLGDNGSHLLDMYNRRKWLDPDLRLRVVQSELQYWINERRRIQEEDHHHKGMLSSNSIEYLIANYDIKEVAKEVTCPVLCIKGSLAMAFLDANGLNASHQFETISQCFAKREVVSLLGERSTIDMINQSPLEFSDLCITFFVRNSI